MSQEELQAETTEAADDTSAEAEVTLTAELATSATEGPGTQWGSMMGAALGFGLGMVFALGGFWAGLLTAIFLIAGYVVGRIVWGGPSGGTHA